MRLNIINMQDSTCEELSTTIYRVDVIDLGEQDNRTARRIVSKNRSLGNYFISIGNRVYKRFELCSKDVKKAYLRKITSTLKTIYFNTLKPLKDLIDEDEKEALHVIKTFEELYEGGIKK